MIRGKGALRFPSGLVSQILSSVSNFLLLLSLARVQDASDFGWTALAVAVVTGAVGVTRSVFGTPIALAAGDALQLWPESRYGVSRGFASALLVGSPLMIWGIYDGDWALLLVGLSAPVVVLHDLLRQVCFAAGRAATAMHSDLLRSAAMSLPLAGTAFTAVAPVVSVGVWASSAAMSALFIRVALKWRSRSQEGSLSASRHPGYQRLSLFGDELLTQITPLANSIVIGSSVGAVALSAFRGGSTLLGPVSILLTAVPLLVLPHLVRERVTAFGTVLTRLLPINLALSLLCVAIAFSPALVPVHVGQLLLGDSWSPTSEILPFMALQFALQPWTLSITTALKLTGEMTLLFRLRLGRSALVVLAVAAVAPFFTVKGVVLAILISELFSTIIYLWIAHLKTASRNG